MDQLVGKSGCGACGVGMGEVGGRWEVERERERKAMTNRGKGERKEKTTKTKPKPAASSLLAWSPTAVLPGLDPA